MHVIMDAINFIDDNFEKKLEKHNNIPKHLFTNDPKMNSLIMNINDWIHDYNWLQELKNRKQDKIPNMRDEKGNTQKKLFEAHQNKDNHMIKVCDDYIKQLSEEIDEIENTIKDLEANLAQRRNQYESDLVSLDEMKERSMVYFFSFSLAFRYIYIK